MRWSKSSRIKRANPRPLGTRKQRNYGIRALNSSGLIAMNNAIMSPSANPMIVPAATPRQSVFCSLVVNSTSPKTWESMPHSRSVLTVQTIIPPVSNKARASQVKGPAIQSETLPLDVQIARMRWHQDGKPRHPRVRPVALYKPADCPR